VRDRRRARQLGRTVRTILGADDDASRLIVGETVHVATGTWSSFPPHRHDRDSPDEDLQMVRDRHVTAITSGFHPLVAAPGHRRYYVWIMARDRRELHPYLDPRYRWLNEER
jgi:5-deoxy-glucuronate isomerase